MNLQVFNMIVFAVISIVLFFVVAGIYIYIIKEVIDRKRKVEFLLPKLDGSDVPSKFHVVKNATKIKTVKEKAKKDVAIKEISFFKEFDKFLYAKPKKRKIYLPQEFKESDYGKTVLSRKPFEHLSQFDRMMEDLYSDDDLPIALRNK